mmetsp:Transcript_28791/g.92964  ORF Transcript_28791/g.92964 Transcript_28791/m.92964 type:complete len:322 (+) Transcript_28791:102-1067(+)
MARAALRGASSPPPLPRWCLAVRTAALRLCRCRTWEAQRWRDRWRVWCYLWSCSRRKLSTPLIPSAAAIHTQCSRSGHTRYSRSPCTTRPRLSGVGRGRYGAVRAIATPPTCAEASSHQLGCLRCGSSPSGATAASTRWAPRRSPCCACSKDLSTSGCLSSWSPPGRSISASPPIPPACRRSTPSRPPSVPTFSSTVPRHRIAPRRAWPAAARAITPRRCLWQPQSPQWAGEAPGKQGGCTRCHRGSTLQRWSSSCWGQGRTRHSGSPQVSVCWPISRGRRGLFYLSLCRRAPVGMDLARDPCARDESTPHCFPIRRSRRA